MYEHFDHTADLGLRAEANTLSELFIEMARCLTAAIVENPSSIAETTSWTCQLEEANQEFILFDWLRALLRKFEEERILGARFELTLTGTMLKATIWGEPVDANKHQLWHEVKAITYHGLTIEALPQGFRAEAIVDI